MVLFFGFKFITHLNCFMSYQPDLMLNLSHHEHEVEQLKKEKDEALAEEMRNTKAGKYF